MSTIAIELTNRCNLACQHCFSGRHGGRDELSLALLQRVLPEAKALGFTRLSFTGGEPTIHRHFEDVLRVSCENEYAFSFVTNGQNFGTVYPVLEPLRPHLDGITFSLDGAREETHDALRGRGSYRKVMQAISTCVIHKIPFSINMVLTAQNKHEIAELAKRSTVLGAQLVRFGHLMPNAITTAQGADLSPHERKQVEAEIWELRRQYNGAITMGPGYHTTDLFPCAPLQMQEVNIDCLGNLTKCCHLSSHGGDAGQGDVIGNLNEMSFTTAYHQLVQENEQFRVQKRQHLSSPTFQDSDFFPCWYCSLHYKKVEWLKNVADHPWSGLMQVNPSGDKVTVAPPQQRTNVPANKMAADELASLIGGQGV